MNENTQLTLACVVALVLALPLAAWLETAWGEKNAAIIEAKEQMK